MRNNIILIGMPDAGKSTVGVILAKTLGMQFVDTDLLIQLAENMKLHEIICQKGVGEFIGIEERVILSLDCDNTVIATGGSVVLSDVSMLFLKSIGVVVYLAVELSELKERITNITTRGIVCEVGETLDDFFEQRVPLYLRFADVTLVGGNGVEKTVEGVVGELGSWGRERQYKFGYIIKFRILDYKPPFINTKLQNL